MAGLTHVRKSLAESYVDDSMQSGTLEASEYQQVHHSMHSGTLEASEYHPVY